MNNNRNTKKVKRAIEAAKTHKLMMTNGKNGQLTHTEKKAVRYLIQPFVPESRNS